MSFKTQNVSSLFLSESFALNLKRRCEQVCHSVSQRTETLRRSHTELFTQGRDQPRSESCSKTVLNVDYKKELKLDVETEYTSSACSAMARAIWPAS